MKAKLRELDRKTQGGQIVWRRIVKLRWNNGERSAQGVRNFIDSARNKQNGKAVSFNTEYFVCYYHSVSSTVLHCKWNLLLVKSNI